MQTKIVYLTPMRKEIWAYMSDPTSDRVTDYRRGRGLADDIGTPYTIEKVRSKDRFVLEAREAYWIKKYRVVKAKAVDVLEHGMNMKA